VLRLHSSVIRGWPAIPWIDDSARAIFPAPFQFALRQGTRHTPS